MTTASVRRHSVFSKQMRQVPSLFTPDELDDTEEITRTEIFILAALPILNLFSAISLIDIVLTSIIIYIKKRQY